MIKRIEEFMGFSLRWLIVIVLLSALVGLFSAKLATIKVIEPETQQQNKGEYFQKLHKQYMQQKIVWEKNWRVNWGVWHRDSTRG